ncbi:hypothetical protein EC957_003069 [Mortierella hygrophila]|uniref:AMP-dependent synthetase/ligase domain-containing protein n=1 Tax=Mortierella hygrophila TaxID=979708 RepID=A0A9P6K180_9FUNG|nr:hypothetical protein EC957_003069 [Mortierella hygrophila]
MTTPPLPYDKDHQGVELPGTRRPGQTGIYRRRGFEDGLRSIPESRPHIRTIYDAFQHGVNLGPNNPMLGHRLWDPSTKTYGPYQWQTYQQVSDRVERFGSGLVHLHTQIHGLSEAVQGWRVGLWSNNRAEWTIASTSTLLYNIVSVGLYDTLGPEAVTFGINHSEIPVVVCSADHIASLLKDSSKMPGLKIIISMDSLNPPTYLKVPNVASFGGPILRTFAADKGIQLYDWDQVEELGQLFPRAHTPPKPQDPLTICYTSGTTGQPKGAILTHANFVAAVAASEIGYILTPDDTGISYLPMAHVFGRALEILLFSTGGRIGYSTGDPLRILEDVSVLQPTFFPTVPRLLNRIYARVYALTAGAPGFAGVVARRALAVKLANLKAGLGNKHAFWDRVLFNKVRMALGGKVERIMTASAPISAEVLSFIRVAFCVDISEAYGQTEVKHSTGGAASTQRGEMEAGHVGPPSPITELKLVDVPELNYFSTDKPYPRGEVCVRGPNVFPGYLKDEKKTKEAIDDEGWLHSGDIGFIKENGTLTVIDRMKNVFKLSIGEYVAVEKIEYQIASRLPIALQFFVHGDPHEPCLVSIFVPDPETFPAFANNVLFPSGAGRLTGKVDDTFRTACQDPKLRRAVLQELTLVAQAAGLKKFEIPRAVLIEPNPFTIENDLLTPTFKIKRHPVVQAYRKQLDQLYREIQSKL